jgi:hypothetical protein
MPDLGYNYFPNTIGYYAIYQVDSIVYNLPFNKIDTFKFQVKELLESYYTDSEEKNTTRIVRYYRNKSTDSWQIRNVWAQRVSATKAERQEENIRFIKLIFPVKKNTRWNINSVNTLEPQIAKIEETDADFELDGNIYPHTCMINLGIDTSLITYKKHYEFYSRGVGLVYSELYDVASNTIDANKPSVLQRIETGVICKRKLIEYNNP